MIELTFAFAYQRWEVVDECPNESRSRGPPCTSTTAMKKLAF